MYTSDNSNGRETKPEMDTTQPSISSVLSNAPPNLPRIKFEDSAGMSSPSSFPHSAPSQLTFDPTNMPPPPPNFSSVQTPDPVLVSDADLLLNLHSPFSVGSLNATRPPMSNQPSHPSPVPRTSTTLPGQTNQTQDFSPTAFGQYPTPSETFGDMVIDTQDIDMSALGAEMMPWDLEYLPHDLMFYGEGSFGVGDDNPEAG